MSIFQSELYLHDVFSQTGRAFHRPNPDNLYRRLMREFGASPEKMQSALGLASSYTVDDTFRGMPERRALAAILDGRLQPTCEMFLRLCQEFRKHPEELWPEYASAPAPSEVVEAACSDLVLAWEGENIRPRLLRFLEGEVRRAEKLYDRQQGFIPGWRNFSDMQILRQLVGEYARTGVAGGKTHDLAWTAKLDELALYDSRRVTMPVELTLSLWRSAIAEGFGAWRCELAQYKRNFENALPHHKPSFERVYNQHYAKVEGLKYWIDSSATQTFLYAAANARFITHTESKGRRRHGWNKSILTLPTLKPA